MGDLDDLYQEVILEHTKKPRNFGKLEGADRSALGHNPLCGDQLTVYLKLEGGAIKDIRFEGAGCSIFKSSASIMTETVKGKGKDEVEALFQKFHALVTKGLEGQDPDELGSLAAFSGVSEYPVRVKCASLAWHTLRSALESKKDPVTTE